MAYRQASANGPDYAVQAPYSPVRTVVERAERVNRVNQHEIDGFLSYEAGFMPLIAPVLELPPAFKVFDELVTSLPVLLRDQTVRLTVNGLPVLRATIDCLPDNNLLRASTLLAIVAHAYTHLDAAGPVNALPESIIVPWEDVTKRLGRSVPALSYADLIVYNWKWKTDTEDRDFCIENLSLLIPTVDNAEEQIFYLTQAEMLARSTPLLENISRAQDAVLLGNLDGLRSALENMTHTLRHISRVTLPKIAPSPTRKSYVDPIVWAKSVAPLAMPIRADVPGPGGIASPLFHMMDEFLRRLSYNSFLGGEAQTIRRTYPKHWQDVIVAAGAVDVESFIGTNGNSRLAQSWQDMKSAYCGSNGLLGLHRRKVFAYLPMAFKMGRSATLAGFSGNAEKKEWHRVNDELEVSRRERGATEKGSRSTEELQSYHDSTRDENLPAIPVSTLVQHSDTQIGFWFAARGRVYDATKYLRFHPGGDKILINTSGRDATIDLLAVSHLQGPMIAKKLDSFVVGTLKTLAYENEAIQKSYESMVSLAYKTTDLCSTFKLNASCLNARLTSAEHSSDLTEQKTRLVVDAKTLMVQQLVPAIATYAESVASNISDANAPAFQDLQHTTGRAHYASIDDGIRALQLCKHECIQLLETFESIPCNARQVPREQHLVLGRCLQRVARLLSALSCRTEK